MNKKLIVINKLGDEFLFFSKMIHENINLLFIGSNTNTVKKHYDKLKDLNLIQSVFVENVKILDNHYVFDEQDSEIFNKYSEIYTYGINENQLKDDIINYLLKYELKLTLTAYKDLPEDIVNLSEDEYYLKYNLMLNLHLTINDNFVEFYKTYSKNDLKIYYNKKYNYTTNDYERSSFIIDVEYAVLFLIKKYQLFNVLLNEKANIISSRVKKEGIKLLTSNIELYDVSIVRSSQDIRGKKIITINYFPGRKYKLIEQVSVPGIIEKLYDLDYKSDINYERTDVLVCLYEKK